jgi:hypothetical protein
MLFEGRCEFQENYQGSRTLTFQRLSPSCAGLLEREITHFGHTHPLSFRTLTAIKFAFLAIPDLVPPAVPLSQVSLRRNVEGWSAYAT